LKERASGLELELPQREPGLVPGLVPLRPALVRELVPGRELPPRAPVQVPEWGGKASRPGAAWSPAAAMFVPLAGAGTATRWFVRRLPAKRTGLKSKLLWQRIYGFSRLFLSSKIVVENSISENACVFMRFHDMLARILFQLRKGRTAGVMDRWCP
jgi:hypothetical protein